MLSCVCAPGLIAGANESGQSSDAQSKNRGRELSGRRVFLWAGALLGGLAVVIFWRAGPPGEDEEALAVQIADVASERLRWLEPAS